VTFSPAARSESARLAVSLYSECVMDITIPVVLSKSNLDRKVSVGIGAGVALAVVPLSSIRQPSALIGQTAVEILLEEASDPSLTPRQVVFQPELVVRESSL